MAPKTLPRTVVQRIFQAYHTPCRNHPHRNCRIRSCITSSPLLLGKVCKQWRSIAWDMPDLWTWIEITESNKNLDGRLQLAKEWLGRASGQPLTIVVHPLPFVDDDFITPLPKKLFDVIGEYSAQWKVLDINIEPIRGASRAIGKPARENGPKFLNWSISGPRGTDGNTLPWLKLTSFTLVEVNINTDFSALMDNSPNLEMLRVQTTIVREVASGRSVPVALPQHLKSLVVKSNHPSRVLENVTASNSLSRLSIIIQDAEDKVPDTITSVMDFVARSQCSLQAFGLSTMLIIDMESLSLLFARLTSTKYLYLDSKDTRNYKQMVVQIPQLLNPSLRVSKGLGILLPGLQVLYYSFVDIGIIPQNLLDMMKCRCHGRDVGNTTEHSLADGEFAKLNIVRFNKTNPRVLVDPLRPEIDEGLEMTYDLPYRGEPFE